MPTKTKQKPQLHSKTNLRVIPSDKKQGKQPNNEKIVMLPIDEIQFSPFNKRYYSPNDLESLAKNIDRNGVIEPIIVHMVDGRPQLISGERRTRASKLAGLKEIPSIVKKGITEADVIFIQLSENLDREDPHPMQVAHGLNELKNRKFSVEEIALRLGRSKAFVYSRLKLMALIEEWQEVFIANKVSTADAFQIATLSADSQKELFGNLCNGWRENSNFRISNLSYYISRFKYDLKRAPFDTKDKNLLADVGACTKCPFNSATLKSLFPEYSKEAFCSNKECFHKKCEKHLSVQIQKAVKAENPEALIFSGGPVEEIATILKDIEGVEELQQLDIDSITVLREPEEPNKDDYTEDYDDSEPEFDEERYKEDVEEYNADMEEYNKQKETAKKGLILRGGEVKTVLFLPERSIHSTDGKRVTAKEVTLAIKNGTVTKELLLAEKERILTKAKRDLELDEEKIMAVVYDQFEKKVEADELNCTLTDADKTAIGYLIFLQIGYSNRDKVEELLFAGESKRDREQFYEVFNKIDSQKLSLMARQVVLNKTECKLPSNPLSQFLYKMAKEAGVDVEAIEKQQQQKAEERQERQAQKLSDIDKRIERLNKKAAAENKEEAQEAA